MRTRRLCRQILMFHRLETLAGRADGRDTPALVSCLRLTYDETPYGSTLQAVQQTAYEQDAAGHVQILSLPPLTFDWQVFTPPQEDTVTWQHREDMDEMNLQQPYQMADLNGEGLAGILYQGKGAWWYRPPVRRSGAGPDGVTWGDAEQLPVLPALRDGGILTDLNSDGYLEWVITAPGVAGYYGRTPARSWQHFIPLSALPAEYAHPHTQMAGLSGTGLTDLVLVGPKSVRLYPGSVEGWNSALNVNQAEGITLPVRGADVRTLVAFSDMDGSGQPHLVEVSADGVRYWPHQGRGRFGTPVSLSGFSQPAGTFNPDRLFLADTDGSGTTDLIYILSDRLKVYRNQSGNCFAHPFIVPLPDGICFDDTCRLQVADIQGLGVASLILTVPHPVPHHHVCSLSVRKPGLLKSMRNNMGARHILHYRSSAQFWLDEKAEAQAAGRTAPVCRLPFPLHTLWRTKILDEITGNRLTRTARYRHGVWDGREREFRGFGFVEICDTDSSSRDTGGVCSPASVRRQWYATGLTEVDRCLQAEFWWGDDTAFEHFTPRFTTGSGEAEATLPDSTIQAQSFWLARAMKGIMLRSELYGVDGSD